MQFIRKYRLEIGILAVFIVGYFLIRLFNILALPIFTDEAIYIRWSQIARFDASWRFISLTDGKQPSFVWIAMNIMRFVEEPLLAGRLVSVFAGVTSLIGLFFLGKELFKNTIIGLFSSFLYLVYPMAMVYDRMALYDSLVGAFMVWGLYFLVLLVRNPRLDTALVASMVIGGGVLTKTSAFFNIYLLPVTLLLFNWQKKKRTTRLIKWITLALLVVILAYAYYSMLRLSPFYHIINEKNAIFVYPLREWLEHPFRFLWGNLLGQWDWLIRYMTWPFVVLAGLSLLIKWSFWREKLLLLIFFAVPFIGLALFGRVLYPRFIFFMTLMLLPLVAFSLAEIISRVRNKILLAVFTIVTFIGILNADYMILTHFAKAPIPFSDLEQYSNGWPAGGGMKEIVEFLDKQSQKGKLYVVTEGTFGSIPTYTLEIYLNENKNIEKRGLWPVPQEIPKDLVERAEEMPVYVVFNETQTPPSWPITLIKKYQKGVGSSYASLYKVTP